MSAKINKEEYKDIKEFDARHNDPEAKVILVSTDKVGFRVHAWYLAEKRQVQVPILFCLSDISSDFVKSLLEFPSSQSLENAPTQLYQSSEHVRKLIDLVYSSACEPIMTARECHALVEICDHLQMTTVKDTIWKMAKNRLQDEKAVGLSPWETFKLGAIRREPKFCTEAIRAMERYGYTVDQICRQPASSYEDIPGRYLATLLTENYHKYNGNYLQCSVAHIGTRFYSMTK